MIDKTKLKPASDIVEEVQVKPTIRLASMAQPEGVDGDEFQSEPIIPTPRPQPEPITGKALGEKKYRFSITPIYTHNYNYALPTEMLMDKNTGSTAVMLANGKYIASEEGGRLKYHLMQFEQDLSYYGMRNSIIKNVLYDDDGYIHLYENGQNLIDDSIYIDEQKYINKMCISIDLDVYEAVLGTPKMQRSYLDPEMVITYRVDFGERHTYRCKYSELRRMFEVMHTISLEIESIKITPDEQGILDKCYIPIHSILVAITLE